MKMLELDNLLSVAKSAARLGGQFILQHQGSDLQILLNEGRDVKLYLDIETEEIIKKIFLLKTPFLF